MNNLVMIDTSCWIAFFRNNNLKIAESVQNLIQNDLACICGITELEIIQGIKSEQQSSMVKDIFTILPYFEIKRSDYINAGMTIKKLRNKGITVSITDSLLAILCIKNNLEIFTIDNDFKYFPELKFYPI